MLKLADYLEEKEEEEEITQLQDSLCAYNIPVSQNNATKESGWEAHDDWTSTTPCWRSLCL